MSKGIRFLGRVPLERADTEWEGVISYIMKELGIARIYSIFVQHRSTTQFSWSADHSNQKQRKRKRTKSREIISWQRNEREHMKRWGLEAHISTERLTKFEEQEKQANTERHPFEFCGWVSTRRMVLKEFKICDVLTAQYLYGLTNQRLRKVNRNWYSKDSLSTYQPLASSSCWTLDLGTVEVSSTITTF